MVTLDLTKNPRDIRDDLQKVSEESKKGYASGWAENVQHFSGFLTGSTGEALQALTNAEYADKSQTGNSYGSITSANRVLPAILRMLARAMQSINGFQGIPATADEQDKDAAKASEKLLTALWYNDRIYEDVVRAIVYAFGCSHGYLLVEGDETLHEPDMVLDQDQKPVPIPHGEVLHEPVAPFDLNLYPGVNKLEDSPVVMVRQRKTKEEIFRRWGGKDREKLEAILKKAPSADYTAPKLATMESQVEKALYPIDRVWCKPDRVAGWPQGRHFVLIGDEILHRGTLKGQDWIETGLPDQPRTWEYPLVDVCDVPVAFGYWGRGRQSAARAPQKILNVAWSKASQVASLPGLIIGLPMGSQISFEQVNNVPVVVLKYNPAGGKGIEFWTPTKMPFYEWVIQKCEEWIEGVYSQPAPSRGESPGSRTPFRGLQLMIEQAELADSPFGRMVVDAVSRLARKLLIEGKRVWPEPMVGYILGTETGRWERVNFFKSRLKDGWDIRVLPDSGLPQSRAGRLGAVMELVQAGLLGNIQEDPVAQKQARKLARVYTEDDAFEPDKGQENVAKDEEEKLLKQGLEAPVHWFDDHQTHFLYHAKAAVERAEIASPEEDKAREQHTMKHWQGLQATAPPPEEPEQVA